MLLVWFLGGRWICTEAQTSDKPWMIGLSYTLIDYQGPLTNNYGKFNLMDPGGTISAHTYLNNLLNLSINTTFAPNVVYPESRERFLQTSLIDVNAVAQFKSNGTIFDEGAFFAPYFSTGFGLNSASNITRIYIPATVGIRLQITESFGLNLEATYKQRLQPDAFQNMSFSGGLVFTLPTPAPKRKTTQDKDEGRKDSDGDGVPDDIDKCPDVKGMQTYLGCLPPEKEDQEPSVEQTLETDAGMFDTGFEEESEPVMPEPQKEITYQDREFIQNAMNRIYFETASSDLLPSSYPTLDSVAMIMRQYPQMKLEVRGYTDNTGSYEINQVLSVMRAYEVKYYLVKQKGIKMRRITSDGYNENNPIASNDTEKGRQLNRRVEFRIIE